MVGKDNLALLWTPAAVGSSSAILFELCHVLSGQDKARNLYLFYEVLIDSISSNLSVYIALTVGVVVIFFGGLAIINNSIDFWGGGEKLCFLTDNTYLTTLRNL